MTIDPHDIERNITPQTKAIIPVHYGGVSCEMDTIMSIAEQHDLFVVEDAAQGVDAFYRGEALGSIGHMGCYSFHDTKNLTCGEGGAFLTNSDEIAQKAEVIREKGTNRAAFMRGEIDKYTWINEGSSYIPSDLLAALLEVQWKKKDEIKHKRRKLWELYNSTLQECEKIGKIKLPEVPDHCESNYHIFYFFARTPAEQELLLKRFKETGIPAAFHYVPLHSAPYARQMFHKNDLPVTDEFSNRLIRLPLYPDLDLTDSLLNKIVQVIDESISN